MKVQGEYVFTADRRRVWDALHDPKLLARALPGAQSLELEGPDSYALTASVGVGSVKGTYQGTFRLDEQQEPDSCTVRASASGTPGSVEATARMRLHETDGRGARLEYEADATLTGPLAGIGQRLVGAAARRTTTDFLAGLDRELSGAGGSATADGQAVQPAPAVGAPRVADGSLSTLLAGIAIGFAAALVGVLVGRAIARPPRY